MALIKWFEDIKQKVCSFLRDVDVVVPKQSLQDFMSEIKSEKILGNIVSMPPPSASASFSGEAVQYLLQNTIKFAVNQVAEELNKHMKTSELIVSKEIQKNDWITTSIKGELESKGFHVNCTYSQTNFSIFGKSLPDFYFYKEGKHIKAGVVAMMQNNDNEEVDINMPVHLTGGTTEFKTEQSNKFWPQMFADMARIANILVVDSLELGHLVASIRIYGLLTEYKTEMSTPMVYTINFENNNSRILVGIEMPFADSFASISTNCLY